MIRALVIVVVVGLTGCGGGGESDLERRIVDAERSARDATRAADDARSNSSGLALRFLRHTSGCVDVNLKPLGFIQLGAKPIYVAIVEPPKPDGAVRLEVLNAASYTIKPLTLRVDDAEAVVGDLAPGAASSVVAFTKPDATTSIICADGVFISYTPTQDVSPPRQ